jgi:hypothetical protein
MFNDLIKRIKKNEHALQSIRYDDFDSPLNVNELTQLVDALIINTNIIYLELPFVNFGEEEACCLAKLLKSNHRICFYIIQSESISSAAATLIARLIEENTQITWFNFEGAGYIDDPLLDEKITTAVKNNVDLASDLTIAAKEGNFQRVKELVEAGASLTYQGDDQNTALHFAGFKQQTEIINYLLNHPDQVILRNGYQQLPLLYGLSKNELPSKCDGLTFFSPRKEPDGDSALTLPPPSMS